MTTAAKLIAEKPLSTGIGTYKVPVMDDAHLPCRKILCCLAMAPVLALAMPVAANAQVITGQIEYSRQIRTHSAARTSPSAGNYVSATGQSFALGRSGSQLLLRFSNVNETWVLRPSSAPRGDTIYRNDAGEQVLRVTASGGMTLYSTRSPGGSPVSRAGGTPPNLEPQAMGPVQLFNLMTRRSGLISNALGRLVQINVSGDESEALCVEALIVTTDTVIRIARSPTAKPFIDRLRVISIVEGSRPAVTYQRGELRIVVDPSRGVAGRPSSARIIRAIIPEQ